MVGRTMRKNEVKGPNGPMMRIRACYSGSLNPAAFHSILIFRWAAA